MRWVYTNNNLKDNIRKCNSYLLLTQLLTPKAPLRFLEAIREYCTLDL